MLTDYGSTRGSPILRRLLLRRFAEEGMDIPPDQLMLTASGTQAIDLICRFLLKPGEDAPDFEAVDHNGNKVRLRDFRGKKVVLWFYPKADTPG